MRLPTPAALAFALLLPAPARADVVWTGAAGRDVFDEANWDLSQSAVTTIDPGVPILDDVVVRDAPAPLEIPDLTGQQRFTLGAGFTLTLERSRMLALGNDGVGAASGPGIDVRVIDGAFEPYFIVGGTRLHLDATSSASLAGPNDPINGSSVDLEPGAALRLPGETPADFLSEHLGKITVAGSPAVVGQNLVVAPDGAAGCVVAASVAVDDDADDDLLTDDEELLRHHTDPLDPDTDGDGTPDGMEVARGLDPLDPQSRLERPNVVFVLVDDLGWGDLGVLFQNGVPGTKRLLTPNLDRMAAEGVILSRHYCPAPVCAPSRASLLTGVHQGHATVRDNQFDKALEVDLNLASVMRRAGYRTSHVGKYGLQGNGSSAATWPAYPTKIGFDSFYGYVRHRDGHNHYPAHDTSARPAMEVWSDDVEVSGGLDRCYTTDLWTARAKAELEDHVQASPQQPFFLYLCYDTPHAALQRPTGPYPAGSGLTGGVQWQGTPGAMINTASGTIDSFVHPDFANRGWTEGEEIFATMVRRLDTAIGDLLDTLEELGIAEDTLVVLTSDNGPHAESYVPGVSYGPDRFDSFGPFDGIKRCVWEGGVRVPTLAWWPGTIPAGRVDGTPSQFHDWMATLCELAGWEVPAGTDGVSLTPLLTGAGQREGGVVYVEYESGSNTPNYTEFDPSHRGRRRGQMQVVVLDGYKGVRVDVQSHQDPFEIYALETDTHEASDLAATSAAFAELERRMRDRVLQLRLPDASAPRPYDGELVPPAAPARARPGLEVASFEGLWPWVPDLARLAPAAVDVAPRPRVEDLTRDEHAGLLARGYLDVPSSGDWTFTVVADGGAVLRLHDILVIDADDQQGTAAHARTVRLAAGQHPFRLDYRTGRGTPALELRWAGPGVPEAPIPDGAFLRVDSSIGAPLCPGVPNSTGAPGRLYVEGSSFVNANDVTLVAEGLPAHTFGLFVAGLDPGFTANPGGSQGNLCLGTTLGRFTGPGQIQASGADGRFALPLDLTHLPTAAGFVGAMSGDTWHFQAWHRDVNPLPTSNLTGASVVTLL